MASTFLPLQADPAVVERYLKNLGACQKLTCVDILGLDEELLKLVPQPVLGLLLVYPITKEVNLKQKNEDPGNPKDKGKHKINSFSSVWFTKQEIASNSKLMEIHNIAAKEDESSIPSDLEHVTNHFIAFVNVNDSLYELDGRKCSPINYGNTRKESFLMDCAKIIKEIMELNPSELNFSLIAIVKSE